MTLKERITEDMKTAMRSGEKDRLAVIRLLQAAIKQREVDERITLDDAQVTSVLEKMIKQRKESVVAFDKGGRADLVAKENSEIAVLQPYLPAQLSESRTRCVDCGCHQLDRRRVHQGHGQGHGRREGEGRRQGRHGCRGRPHQSQARRLIGRPWHRHRRRADPHRADLHLHQPQDRNRTPAAGPVPAQALATGDRRIDRGDPHVHHGRAGDLALTPGCSATGLGMRTRIARCRLSIEHPPRLVNSMSTRRFSAEIPPPPPKSKDPSTRL